MLSHAAYFKLSLVIEEVLEEHERKLQLKLPQWVTPISEDLFTQLPGANKSWRFPFPTDRLSPFGASLCLLICGAAFLLHCIVSPHSNASYRVTGNAVDGCLLMFFGVFNIWLLRRERHHRLKVPQLNSNYRFYPKTDLFLIWSRSTRQGCV